MLKKYCIHCSFKKKLAPRIKMKYPIEYTVIKTEQCIPMHFSLDFEFYNTNVNGSLLGS